MAFSSHLTSTTRDVVNHCLPFVKGDVLDFGAGNAKYRNIIKPCSKTYTTLDMFKNEHIDIVADVLHTGLPDNSYDTIISTQVLEHVEKPWDAVIEMGRLLRKDGFCIITAPFLLPQHADPSDYFRYTKEGLGALARNAGLEVIEGGPYGGKYAVISEAIHFSMANPYSARKSSFHRFWPRIEKFLLFLDKRNPPNDIYANVYVVAKKK